MRIQSSSRCSVRWRFDSAFSSLASRACFCSSQPGVVALVREAGGAIELENPARDVVEKVAIVRHGDDGARIVLEKPLEPRHRLGVEVVGGLVEQQQIGRLQQQPAQRDAAPLAAGQRRRRRRRAGGSRSESIAISSRESRSQAFDASILSCSRDCSSRTLSISSGDRSSPSFMLTAS